MLTSILADIPIFEKYIPCRDVPQSVTLMDVNNFHITRLVLDSKFLIPEIVSEKILSIAEDQKRINELLYLLNPDSAGLGNYIGGLAWAMLQYLIENEMK